MVPMRIPAMPSGFIRGKGNDNVNNRLKNGAALRLLEMPGGAYHGQRRNSDILHKAENHKKKGDVLSDILHAVPTSAV